MKRLLFVLLALVLLICPASGRCADAPPQRAGRFDEKAFGRLPIQFNGRVTDFDHYARNALLRISGQQTWVDSEGQSQPAIAWLLNLICDSEFAQSAPIVLIEQPALQELFGLPAASKVRHFAIKELIPNLAAFEQHSAAIENSNRKLTSDERFVLDLADRLDFLSRVMAVFRLPDVTTRERLIASLQLAKEMEKRAVPFVVPPKEPGGEWLSLPFAVIAAHLTKETDSDSNPAGVLFAKLIAAHRNNDPAMFSQVVRELSLLIEDRKLADSPFGFSVPQGWYEVGTPRLVYPYYFQDARAFGTTVTSLNLFEGTERLMIHVNFFPQGAARKEHIVNSWRLSNGLIPLRLEDVRTEAVTVAGEPGWQTDIETPNELPIARERTRAVGVTLGTQSWVIACSGSKELMKKHVKEFDQFVASIVISSPAAAEKWFTLPKAEPAVQPAGTKAVLAVVHDDQTAWVVRSTYFAENMPDQQIEKLKSVLKSIRFRTKVDGNGPNARFPFAWTLPEDWNLEESSEGQLWVVCRTCPAFVAFEIAPVKTESDWSRSALINQWRAGLRLPELPAEEIETATEMLMVDKRQIMLIVADVP